jgi:hypothetical protein
METGVERVRLTIPTYQWWLRAMLSNARRSFIPLRIERPLMSESDPTVTIQSQWQSRELKMPTLTTEKSKTSVTFRLNGKLMGPVVTELETSWRVAKYANLTGMRLDLRKVKEIDDTGKDLLKQMFCDGVQFVVAAHPQRNR